MMVQKIRNGLKMLCEWNTSVGWLALLFLSPSMNNVLLFSCFLFLSPTPCLLVQPFRINNSWWVARLHRFPSLE